MQIRMQAGLNIHIKMESDFISDPKSPTFHHPSRDFVGIASKLRISFSDSGLTKVSRQRILPNHLGVY